MREIKFRFYPENPVANFHWDDVQKMWQAEVIDLDAREITNGSDVFNLDEVNVMQYVWLTDKNGKELYEGDICKVLYSDWISKSDKDERSIEQYMFDISTTGEVTFNNNMFCFKFWDYHDYLSVWPHWQIVVIWNIYENPELINK